MDHASGYSGDKRDQPDAASSRHSHPDESGMLQQANRRHYGDARNDPPAHCRRCQSWKEGFVIYHLRRWRRRSGAGCLWPSCPSRDKPKKSWGRPQQHHASKRGVVDGGSPTIGVAHAGSNSGRDEATRARVTVLLDVRDRQERRAAMRACN